MASPETNLIQVTPDLALHPMTSGDALLLYPLVERNRARLKEWLPWLSDSYDEASMESYVADRLRHNEAGKSLTSCIRVGGEVCGAISLHQLDHNYRSSSIGYWLAAEFEGRGIMTEACRALVNHGFVRYGLHRIEIRCAIGNSRSKGIPRRLGFREEGVLKEAEWLHDHWVDLRLFAMLDHEWTLSHGDSGTTSTRF